MIRTIRFARFGMLLIAVLLVSTSGCGSPSAKITPVEGIVKLDGKPAGGIMVQFMPDSTRGGNGPTSFAVTDAEGKFKLKTYEGKDGAVVGPHLVILMDNEEDRPAQGTVSRKPIRLATRYGVATPGQLSVEVQESGAAIELAATAK